MHIPNDLNQRKLLFYQEFGKNKNNEIDIPIYRNDIKEGFSIFCTLNELEIINNYVDDDYYSNINSLNNMFSEIEPVGRYCELCHKKFLSYSIHVKSNEHIENINSESKKFDKIDLTFKRIKLYNNGDNKSKDGSFFTSHNLNSNISTYDSIKGSDKNISSDNYDIFYEIIDKHFLKKKRNQNKKNI